MGKLSHFLLGLLKQEEGPTAVEYAVLLGLIIVVCISAILSIGNNIDETAEIVSGTLGS
jgi:pilus assembly protein Flp/PilA